MIDISIKVRQAAAALCAALSLAACTGGVHSSGSSSGTASEAQYTVGGTVSGLAGSGLVLASNTGETVNVGTDGTFSFKTTFPDGSPYYVLVLTQPDTPTQTCVATNGSGTIQSSNVTGITVACKTKVTPTDTIGGVIVGLTGSGLVLQNGYDTLTVAADGAFVFPTALPSGTPYSVSVLTPPIKPYEDCAVLNGKGTTDSSDITNIGIVCTVNSSSTHTISGTITGVTGTIVLENNGRDDLTLTADGAFKFPLAIPSGSSYDVTTKSATGLLSQACTFANATGMVGDSDITNVTITCAANGDLAAIVSGLAGSGLTLRNTDSADTVTVTANGTVIFPTGLVAGQAYNVTITGQPTNPAQTCVVGNGAGTAPEATPVTVSCTSNPTYTVTGTVSGLAGTGLTLQNTGDGDIVTVTANGTVTFPTQLGAGQRYNVTITGQPSNPTQTCVLGNGTGALPETTVVTVACTTNTYAVTGTVSGLSGTGLTLQNTDTGDTLPVAANGTVTFPTLVPSDQAYNITVAAQPAGPTQTCVVTNGAGTAPETLPITVACTTNTYLVGGVVNGFPDPQTQGSVPFVNLVLQDSAGDTYSIAPNSTSPVGFSFPTPLPSGSTYSVSIQAQPGFDYSGGQGVETSSVCLVTGNGTGVVTNANVTNVQITCLRPNGFAYVTNSLDNTVSPYLIDIQSGDLVPSGPPVSTGSFPTAAVVAPTGNPNGTNFLYVTNSGSNNVSGYSIDPNTGALTPLPASPFTMDGLNTPTSIAATQGGAEGSFLYVTNPAGSGPGSVTAATFGATGALTDVPGSPFLTGARPTSALLLFAQTTAVNFLLETNTADNILASFQPDSTGALTPGTPFPTIGTGNAPTSVAGLSIFPAGAEASTNVLYVANSGDNTISTFQMANGGGGLFTLNTYQAGATGLQSITAVQGTQACPCFVFASAQQGIVAFNSAEDGTLTALPGSPFAAGAAPGPIAALETAFVYVVNTTDQTVTHYFIEGTNQALALAPDRPAQTGRGPTSIVVTLRPTF